jgi:hypothetical protein
MSRTLFSCLQEKVQENRGVSGLAFLPCGHGSVLAGVRSIRFDQGPRLEFLLHLLQSFAHVQLLRVCRHRRASVGDGRPSACHGCAVACIGQPPPPSAPWPGGMGWVVGPVWGPRLRWRGASWLAGGRGPARSGLARLRGCLHLQGLICLGLPSALAPGPGRPAPSAKPLQQNGSYRL